MWFQSLRGWVLLLLAAGLLAAGTGLWLCAGDEGVAFLSERAGGAWIMPSVPPQGDGHKAVASGAIFTRTFVLTDLPVEALAESFGLCTRPDYQRGSLPKEIEEFIFKKMLGEV
jgi:hypothetical protein